MPIYSERKLVINIIYKQINFKSIKSMDKKNLKWYEAPQVEVVEMELQGMLCLSAGRDPDEGKWGED